LSGCVSSANARGGIHTIDTHRFRTGVPTIPDVSTIHPVLQGNSLVTPPSDRWQTDSSQAALSDGSVTCVIDILDDHARVAIGAAARRFTAMAAWRAM
jgi:hypothetical protein